MTDRDNLDSGAENTKDTVTSSEEVEVDTVQNDVPVDGTVSGNNSSDSVSDNQNDSVDKSNRKGLNNLVPFNTLTVEEQRKMASKGGKASVEARKKKKHMREIAQALLAHDMTEDQIDEVLGTSKSLSDGDLSVAAVLTARMIQEAADGNYKAYEVLRDTAGYKPKDQVEVENISEADKALLERIAQRVGLHNPTNSNQING